MVSNQPGLYQNKRIGKENYRFSSSVVQSFIFFWKTHWALDYFLQFRKILLSRPPLESVHLSLPSFFLPLSLAFFKTFFVFRLVSLLPPSVSFALPGAFPNGAAKLLFPSHYLICASPLSCKSSRYSSLFSINSIAVKLQLPITKHCWGRKEELRQRQGERQTQGNRKCSWNTRETVRNRADASLQLYQGIEEKLDKRKEYFWANRGYRAKRESKWGVTDSGLLAAIKTTGNRDNSIPFPLPYFSGKDKTQHAGNAKNIPN